MMTLREEILQNSGIEVLEEGFFRALTGIPGFSTFLYRSYGKQKASKLIDTLKAYTNALPREEKRDGMALYEYLGQISKIAPDNLKKTIDKYTDENDIADWSKIHKALKNDTLYLAVKLDL